jgi:cysteinyl-tRNA synthetase
LQFPHHENEIAQSEGTHGHQHVNYWIHNGFVRIDNEKMSKSLGNFFTIREVLAKYDPEVVRFFILRAHYRSPLNYSDQHLDDAKGALSRLYTALKNVVPASCNIDWRDPFAARFKTAMDDDFNTPEAMAVLFELAGEINRTNDPQRAGLLRALGGVLGLLQRPSKAYFQGSMDGWTTLAEVSSLQPNEYIERLIEERAVAKKAKNYTESDRIRQELLDAGVVLEDGPQGTVWRRN